MKKTLLILLLVFLINFFSGSLFAITPTPTPDPDVQSSYTMECLLPPDNAGIATREIHGSESQLIAAKPPPSITMTLSGQCSSAEGCDLVLCTTPNKRDLALNPLAGGQGVPRSGVDHSSEQCTTGNSEKDIYYFGQDYTRITTATLTAPSLVDNHMNPGPVTDLEVILNHPEPHSFYSFYAVGKAGGILLPTVTGGVVPSIAENRTQQLGTISSVSAPQTGLATGEEGKCQTIFWDPYGRVFDGISLEPLNKNEAMVTLLNKDTTVVAIPGNNVNLDVLGKYNILIDKDGEYRLNVVPATSHQFADFIPDLRYKDLYESIFMPSDPAFFESISKPIRMDVALKPVSTPYSRQIDVVQTDYKQVWAGGKKYIKIEIRTTHPRSIFKLIINDIIVKDNGEGTALPTTADKNGYWKIMVRDYKVLSQKGFRVEISKNPQYYMFAGSTGNKLIIDFDPILSYIEGYTYDDNGLLLPNTKIEVRLKMNDSVFYETRSDDQGFFTIDSANLPPMDYYLVFVGPSNSQSIKKTTAKFVIENATYLDKEKINLFKGEKNGKPIVKNIEKVRDYPSTSSIQQSDLEKKIANAKKTRSKFSSSLLIGLFGLTMLILIVGAIIVSLFFRKPKTTF